MRSFLFSNSSYAATRFRSGEALYKNTNRIFPQLKWTDRDISPSRNPPNIAFHLTAPRHLFIALFSIMPLTNARIYKTLHETHARENLA